MIADIAVPILLEDPADIVGILVKIILEGFGKGAVFFTIAVGLTLIFGLMGVLNFAHGAWGMLGAYLGGLVMVLVVTEGMGQVAAVVLFFVAIAVTFALLTAAGAAMEIKLMRPIYDRTPMYQIILTFGVALILEELIRITTLWAGQHPDVQWRAAMETLPSFLDTRYDILGVNIRGLFFFEIVFGLVLVGLVYLFLNRTLYGLYVRAGSEDPEMVQALGINVRRAFTVVFGLGMGLAAVGGVLLMWDPLWGPTAALNIDVLLYAFVVVIIGGLGSFKGTVAAAFLVGLADSTATWLFDTGIIDHSGLPEITVFGILVVMLILRPQGLFGVEEVGGH